MESQDKNEIKMKLYRDALDKIRWELEREDETDFFDDEIFGLFDNLDRDVAKVDAAP